MKFVMYGSLRLKNGKEEGAEWYWGARGVFSERDADAFAIRKVREYRRHIMQEKEKR